MLPCAVDDVGLDNQIVMNKFCWVGIVGVNAAHLGCRKYDVLWFFGSEKGLNCSLIEQFELGMRTQQQIVIPATFQLANQR